MNIYIPTRGRWMKQRTFEQLPQALKEDTYLVVDTDQEPEYLGKYHGFLVFDGKGIALKRDFILSRARKLGFQKIVMVDDDIIFQRKRADGKITNCTMKEVVEGFQWLSNKLDTYAHAGFSVRFSDRGTGSGDRVNGRMMHVLAYNLDMVPEDITFTKGFSTPETMVMEDFHMTLQLLEAGYPNIVSDEWRVSPSASNSAGGCSGWRTAEIHNEGAEFIARYHHQFVTVREKPGWAGVPIKDVTVQWKKAGSHGNLR